MDGWPYGELETSDEDDMSDEDYMSDEDDALTKIRKNHWSCQNYELMMTDGKTVQQLTEALQGNTHLKRLSLNIYSLKFDAKTLASAIANTKLTHLILDRRHFRKGEDITNYLLGAAKQSSTIQHLEVYPPDDKCLDKIASCMPHLQSLHLHGVNRTMDIERLCEGLRSTSSLTSLHLSCTIGSTDFFRQFSQALANNSSITSLHLDNCHMGNDCVKAFLEYWHRSSQIHTPAFNYTEIKAEGALLLIQAASSHPAMESLSIKGNRLIGYDGLANIAVELPNIVLKSLNMAECSVFLCYGRNRKNMSKAAVVMGGLIMQGVSANTHLIEIDVLDNGLNATGQGLRKALAYYTLRNKYSPLMVTDSLLPASFWCHCFAKNGQSASIIFHFLREQPTLWRVCCKNKRQRSR